MRSIDRRFQVLDMSVHSQREEFLADLAPPGVKVEGINAVTLTPHTLRFDHSVPDGQDDGALIRHALETIDKCKKVLGFEDGTRPVFDVDSRVSRTAGGGATVHLRQRIHGKTVFGMHRTVLYSPNGNLIQIDGDNVSPPRVEPSEPELEPEEAVRKAVHFMFGAPQSGSAVVAVEDLSGGENRVVSLSPGDVSEVQPREIASLPVPSGPQAGAVQSVQFDADLFPEPIRASLIYFHTGRETILAWEILLTLPSSEEVIVIARAQAPSQEAILFLQDLTSAANVDGFVYQLDKLATPRRRRRFPEPAASYPFDNFPRGFPRRWLDGTNPARPEGNNARAENMLSGAVSLTSMREPGVIVLRPEQDEGEEQWALNAFYFCNYLHDFFYFLGFDEKAGCFQDFNFTPDNGSGDPLLALVSPRARSKLGAIKVKPDGNESQMLLYKHPVSGRHSALDFDVVAHEYTHGVSQRLVGGTDVRGLCVEDQSKALREGWADYFALTIRSFVSGARALVLGRWVTGLEEGFRDYRGLLAHPPSTQEVRDLFGRKDAHQRGMPWCATLVRMNERFEQILGNTLGHRLGWKLVVEGMPKLGPGPGLLDARKKIFHALCDLETRPEPAIGLPPDAIRQDKDRLECALWKSFAEFGLGEDAISLGVTTQGYTAGFAIPKGCAP